MENYIVSARKYRPSTFASVVGQAALTTTLKNAIKSNHLAHAYLFCGPRGVGKTTCARIFAKTINCQNPTNDFEACNECESCRSFNEQRSYNIHELDAASNNSVDDMRSLIDQVRVPPQIGKYSVYIIDEVHMLSSNAFNAFLKTLEEPPAHAIFILATTEKHKIIPTILSRCQIYDFSRITVKDTINHLKYVAEKEGINASTEALNVIAKKSDGGMRDALSIFDQLVSFCGNTITYENTIATLNVLDYEYYFQLVDKFLNNNVSESLLIFNEILNKGFDAQYFVTGLSSHFRDVLVSKNPETIVLLEVGEDIAKRYQEQAQKCSANFIFEALKITNECDINYRTAKNKRLLVELMLIRLCQITNEGEKKNTSHDIAPINEQPEKSTVVANKETSVAQPASTAILPKPTAPVTQKQPIEKSVTLQKPQSISILANLKTDTVEKATTEPNPHPSNITVTQNKPYTEDDLQSAWISYIKQAQDNMRLMSIIQTEHPHIVGENIFEITVSTGSQEKELTSAKQSILEHIRKQIGNDLISMQINISKTIKKSLPLTAKDTYNMLVEKNPALQTLKNKMGLRLE